MRENKFSTSTSTSTPTPIGEIVTVVMAQLRERCADVNPNIAEAWRPYGVAPPSTATIEAFRRTANDTTITRVVNFLGWNGTLASYSDDDLLAVLTAAAAPATDARGAV